MVTSCWSTSAGVRQRRPAYSCFTIGEHLGARSVWAALDEEQSDLADFSWPGLDDQSTDPNTQLDVGSIQHLCADNWPVEVAPKPDKQLSLPVHQIALVVNSVHLP